MMEMACPSVHADIYSSSLASPRALGRSVGLAAMMLWTTAAVLVQVAAEW